MSEDYFNGEVKHQLQGIGVSLDLIYSYQRKVSDCYEAKNYKGLQDILNELEGRYPTFVANGLGSYLQTLSTNEVIDTQVDDAPRDPTPYFNALKAQLYASKEKYSLLKVDVDLNFEETKDLIRKLALSCQLDNAPFNSDAIKIPFLITNSFVDTGMVLSKLFGSQRAVTLVTGYVAEQSGEVRFAFFGSSQGTDARGLHRFASYTTQMWIYRFQSDSGKQYLLVSKDPVDLQYCKVRGMVVDIRDNARIGDSARIPVNLPMVFVYDQIPSVNVLSHEEFEKAVKAKGFDREGFSKHIFGSFRHPPFFERLMLGWLFSGKYGNPPFPLHLGWLSVAGGGKSTLMERLSALFQEEVAGGSGSTMKGLVPNYGGQMPDEGYLCQRRRIALVDEFFAVVRRAGQADKTDTGTDLMQEILEHRQRINKSGRGESGIILTKPRMKVLFATNTKHYHLLRNMSEIADNMNNAFLSRVLWYVQTPQHVAFVNRHKDKVELQTNNTPDYQAWLMEWYDYCNVNSLPVEIAKVGEIVEDQYPLVPEKLHEVYRGRMQHHVACLIDGLAKVSFMCNERDKLEVQPADYEQARELLSVIVGSWNNEVDLMKMPVRAREHYLSIENKDVYDFVCKNVGINRAKLDEVFKEAHIEGRLNFLKQYELIRTDNYQNYYPFWSTLLTETEAKTA